MSGDKDCNFFFLILIDPYFGLPFLIILLILPITSLTLIGFPEPTFKYIRIIFSMFNNFYN
jgi:hypothetical protein